MAELTAKKRKKLKKSQFAMPGERKYPIHDRPHATNALARARQQRPSTYVKVLEKACGKFPGMPACGRRK